MSAPLSSRLRAGIECAPWVIDEVKRLEARLAEKPRVPEGYALIGIDALKAWGVHDQVRDACRYPVAQQPQDRPDFTDEWTGYLKDGETPFERFLRERKDMQSVLKLYQRVLEENERLKGQQPQAEWLLGNDAGDGAGDRQPQAETDESIAADAYGLACDEMERWQHERRKAGKKVGTTGSLCDGIAWLYGYIDDLEAKQPQAEAVPPTIQRLPADDTEGGAI